MKTTLRTTLLLPMIPLLASMGIAQDTQAKTGRPMADLAQPITRGMTSGWRASEVIGKNVKNSSNDTIGDIADLMVNMKSGEIISVIISTGGFLGIADSLTSVPVNAVRYDAPTQAFKTSMTREQLQSAPAFKSTEWPTYSEQVSSSSIQNYQKDQDPAGTDVDNTARNKRDRDDQNVTPMDQGNSDADIATTKNIRSAVMNTDVGFNAKNIKIITNDSQVVLRGVVATQAEHQKVLAITKQHADAPNITDLIEVKND